MIHNPIPKIVIAVLVAGVASFLIVRPTQADMNSEKIYDHVVVHPAYGVFELQTAGRFCSPYKQLYKPTKGEKVRIGSLKECLDMPFGFYKVEVNGIRGYMWEFQLSYVEPEDRAPMEPGEPANILDDADMSTLPDIGQLEFVPDESEPEEATTTRPSTLPSTLPPYSQTDSTATTTKSKPTRSEVIGRPITNNATTTVEATPTTVATGYGTTLPSTLPPSTLPR
ncbi:hypothetical protein CMI37_13300 [Candidatus Pacearchaeota archaeon]|nr:hypothetical protein [Candidatus Pacearchaeota archaeon]|tara:strand:- start:5590 stop:6264 length:675 start_codon:yes stop_codon:yes gene_type:complete